jgi:hypothetical protein
MFELDVSKIWDGIIAILLASGGALARLLNTKHKNKLKWRMILAEIFMAGFSGILVLMAADAIGVSGNWVGVICGISGWSGPMMLHALTGITERLMGLKRDELKKDE